MICYVCHSDLLVVNVVNYTVHRCAYGHYVLSISANEEIEEFDIHNFNPKLGNDIYTIQNCFKYSYNKNRVRVASTAKSLVKVDCVAVMMLSAAVPVGTTFEQLRILCDKSDSVELI